MLQAVLGFDVRRMASLWDAAMLSDAERALRNASRRASLGRYQPEASIQAVHAARGRTGATDWHALAHLYAGLVSRDGQTLSRVSVPGAKTAGRSHSPIGIDALSFFACRIDNLCRV